MKHVVVSIRIGAIGPGVVRAWGRRLGAHLVQNVPEEMSICEYECLDPRCNTAKRAVCVKCSSHREGRYLAVE
jgi:hypothetical protein